jgi:hypothetical protein
VVAPVLIGLMLTLTAEPAQRTADDYRAEAEAAFAEGVQQAGNQPNEARFCFGCAAAQFDKLQRSGVASPALSRNLGNAWLLARDPNDPADRSLPQAILAYRQGLRLDPANQELHRNLEFARQQVNYPAPGMFGLPATDHRPPWLPCWPGVLLSFAVAGYTFAVLALARWWMVRRNHWLTIAACGFAFAILFGAGLALEAWQIRDETRHPVVVIAQDGVQLLIGNGSRYPPRYETPVNRGVEARLRYDRGKWLQIELGTGEIGWVPRQAVLVDVP